MSLCDAVAETKPLAVSVGGFDTIRDAMRAFEIYRNGKRLCTAGIGDYGVLTAIVCSTLRSARPGTPASEDLSLDVGGLISPNGEILGWKIPRIRPGDEIRIRVVDVTTVDEPGRREHSGPEETAKRERDYVERTAKKLGWTITKGTRPRPKKRLRG